MTRQWTDCCGCGTCCGDPTCTVCAHEQPRRYRYEMSWWQRHGWWVILFGVVVYAVLALWMLSQW